MPVAHQRFLNGFGSRRSGTASSGRPGATRGWSACAATAAADRHALYRHLECGAGARRFDLIRSGSQVVAGHRPTIAPEQGTDVEHADATTIEIRLVMTRELLHAVAKVEQAEVSGSDEATAGSRKQLPSALQHVDAHVVEERARHGSRA